MIGQLNAGTTQALLDALDGIAYLVDLDTVVCAVGLQGWRRSSGTMQSDVQPVESVLNRSLFDMIGGEEVRRAYMRLHDTLFRDRRPSVVFDYRCDSPETERHMRMAMYPVRVADRTVGILYQSQILRELPRPPIDLLAAPTIHAHPGAAGDQSIVSMCSYCHVVAWPVGTRSSATEWIEPAEYYRRGGSGAVLVSHAICPACFDRIVAAHA